MVQLNRVLMGWEGSVVVVTISCSICCCCSSSADAAVNRVWRPLINEWGGVCWCGRE